MATTRELILRNQNFCNQSFAPRTTSSAWFAYTVQSHPPRRAQCQLCSKAAAEHPKPRKARMSTANPPLPPAPAPLPLQTDSPFLREMLSHPIQFGEVYSKSSFAPTMGVREVMPGPPSPPSHHSMLHSADFQNAEAGPSTPPQQNGFIGPIALPPGPATSTPLRSQNGTPKAPEQVNGTPVKGGEGRTTPSPHKGKARESDLPPLFPPIPVSSLSWPATLRGRKEPAAGLNNPSMACYANATLQVLLHTPALLGIMEGHTKCKLDW